MKNQHFDLVTVIKEIENENRLAVVVMTQPEIDFLMEEARNMPEGVWDGPCRRKKVEV